MLSHFFAGFMTRRSITKSCKNCRNDIMKIMNDATAMKMKNISNSEYLNKDKDAPTVIKLVRLITAFTNIKTLLMAFNRTWQYYWASMIFLTSHKIHVEWFDVNHECYNHRKHIEIYDYTI